MTSPKWIPINKLRGDIDSSTRYSVTASTKGEVEFLTWEVIKMPIKEAAMANLNDPMEFALRSFQYD